MHQRGFQLIRRCDGRRIAQPRAGPKVKVCTFRRVQTLHPLDRLASIACSVDAAGSLQSGRAVETHSGTDGTYLLLVTGGLEQVAKQSICKQLDLNCADVHFIPRPNLPQGLSEGQAGVGKLKLIANRPLRDMRKLQGVQSIYAHILELDDVPLDSSGKAYLT